MTHTPTAFPELPDLDKLEALARAATPGPWRHYKARLRPGAATVVNEVQPRSGEAIVRWSGFDGMNKSKSAVTADARFIAAANPAAVLALIALARRAQPESEAPAPEWGRVRTVADMVRNLLTLDQGDPIHAAFPIEFQGARRMRTSPITISRERVIDGKWLDQTRKDVPYAVVVWAKPDERAQQAAAPGALAERDLSKPAEQQGMFRKFDVRRTDGSDAPGGKHHGCRYYVLDLTHDQHAPAAMRAYADACAVTHPLLAADIAAEFGAAPSAPGTPEAPKGVA